VAGATVPQGQHLDPDTMAPHLDGDRLLPGVDDTQRDLVPLDRRPPVRVDRRTRAGGGGRGAVTGTEIGRGRAQALGQRVPDRGEGGGQIGRPAGRIEEPRIEEPQHRSRGSPDLTQLVEPPVELDDHAPGPAQQAAGRQVAQEEGFLEQPQRAHGRDR
jgi:hypothetical protein